jgi:hypothetical protein
MEQLLYGSEAHPAKVGLHNNGEIPHQQPREASMDNEWVSSHPIEDIPPEVIACRENLSLRENNIMNIVGLMAFLDGEFPQFHGSDILIQFMRMEAGVTAEEFTRLNDLHNEIVDVCEARHSLDEDELAEILRGGA